MTRRGKRELTAGLLTALALTLSGCTATASPTPVASSTAGTVIPATPTPTLVSPAPSAAPIAAPERPTAMDRDDAEGALAAMTHFIALYGYAYATGDVEEWQAMSDPECVFCAGLTTDVQGAAATGARLVGGELTVTSFESTPGTDSNIFRVEITVMQAPYEEIDGSGNVTSTGPGSGPTRVTAALEHGATWIVRAAAIDDAAQ